jgi:hypothetical protein
MAIDELQDLGLGLRGWRRRVNKLREVGVNRDDLLVIVVRSVRHFKGEMRECPIGLRTINNARARATDTERVRCKHTQEFQF